MENKKEALHLLHRSQVRTNECSSIGTETLLIGYGITSQTDGSRLTDIQTV